MELVHGKSNGVITLKWISAALFFLLSFFILSPANAQDADTIFACDTCDYQKAQWIAAQNAPPPSCMFTQNPESAPTPDDMYCTSEYQTYIVANTLTEQAFKFRVHIPCYDTWCDYASPATQSLSLRADELADLQLFYDIDRDLREALQELHSSSTNTLSIPTISFNQEEQQILTASGVSESECFNSPVKYFTDAEWRDTLLGTLAFEVTEKAGNKTFAAYTTSVGLEGFSLGANQVGVDFRYNEGDLYIRSNFGAPMENSLHFRVEYRGNAYQGKVASQDLAFVLSPETSFIDGLRVSNFTQGGVANLESLGADIGCLSLLLNFPLFVDSFEEGGPEWVPVDPFAPFTEEVHRCLVTATGFGCILLPNSERQCAPTTVQFWEMCSNEFP
ncbi:MAG: hypothetical protein LAT53_11655 [Idiomarina sp.]|nr:hypothetical protein [Idiomarina sp.]